MKGIFDPYVLWPFDKKLIFHLVTRVRTRNYTVEQKRRILARIFHLSIFDSFQVDDDDDGSRATAMQPSWVSSAPFGIPFGLPVQF